MLLQELMGVKRFHKYTIEQLFKMFRRLGVEMSHGKFGTVFMHPSWAGTNPYQLEREYMRGTTTTATMTTTFF